MLCLIWFKFDDVSIYSFHIVKGFVFEDLFLFTLLSRSAILAIS